MRASKRSSRRTRQDSRPSKLLGDLSPVRTWRRRNDDSPQGGRLEVRALAPAASSAAVTDSRRESKKTTGENHSAVGLLQACGLVVLVCAGALAIFAGWGRADLVQLAAIFAVVGIGLVVASLLKHSSRAETVSVGEKVPPPSADSKGTIAPPWAALDQRVQRLVRQLEKAFEK